jgi:GNAT superfamily N-acetyltransferase
VAGRIRPAQAADLDLLPDIERSAGQAFRGTVHDWIADDQVTPAQTYVPLAAEGLVWVAVDSAGPPVGFVACEIFQQDLHVWELAVRRERQGGGLGRALMEAARQAAAARGLSALTLTTFRTIAWNAPFYERLGFEAIAPEQTPQRLADILAVEAERGLADRCAMRLGLDQTSV